MRNLATAAPLGVNRSSGSSTRLPTRVMTVSPAAMFGWLLRSALVGADDLGAQHGLVEVQLPVELLDGRGLGLQVDDRVDALALLGDLEGHPTTSPDVDLLDLAAVLLHDGQELVESGSDGALLDVGVEDHHQFVVTHADNPPPLDSAATVSPWQEGFCVGRWSGKLRGSSGPPTRCRDYRPAAT